MKSHPRYKHTLDDLFLHTFVYVDDWLKENKVRFQLPQKSNQVASYSELFTIALVGEMQAQAYESVWYAIVLEQSKHLFPHLPEYSRYHRILRNAEYLFAELARTVLAEDKGLKIIDSKPLAVAKGKRVTWAKCLEATKGFSTMGQVFGFKLHALVTDKGLFDRWLFASADIADVTAGRQLIDNLNPKFILGDKAYIGMGILTPKRKNMKAQRQWTAFMNRVRKRIESSFASLVRSFNLHVAQVKTFASLRTRVNIKIAAFNLLHADVL